MDLLNGYMVSALGYNMSNHVLGMILWMKKNPVPVDMGVSKNNGTPQIIHFNKVFHYKPSILEYTLIFGNIHMENLGCTIICRALYISGG